jgi:hypothetical protein
MGLGAGIAEDGTWGLGSAVARPPARTCHRAFQLADGRMDCMATERLADMMFR